MGWFYDNVLSPIGDAISDVGDFLYNEVPLVRGVTDAVTDLFNDPTKPGGIGDFLTGGAYTANATNERIAHENIAFQQRENELIRQREDNAVQRAAADMRAAGLSQTLAAGHPASTSVTQAPQNNYQMQKIDKLGAIMSLAKMKQDLKTSSALANKYSAEAAGQNLSNGVFAQGFATEQAVKRAQVDVSLADAHYKEALSRLNNIKGETYSEFILAELDKLKSDTKLTNEEITYKVAQRLHLSLEDEKVIKDVLESEARLKNYVHDLAYAQKYNLPVGLTAGGLLGGTITTGYSLGNRVKSKLSSLLNNFVLPDNISTSISGGGNVW